MLFVSLISPSVKFMNLAVVVGILIDLPLTLLKGQFVGTNYSTLFKTMSISIDMSIQYIFCIHSDKLFSQMTLCIREHIH